jgi:hypothetical protein
MNVEPGFQRGVYDGPEAAVDNRTPISKALDDLDKVVEHLATTLTIHAERIDIVLRPDEPHSVGTRGDDVEKTPAAPSSAVARIVRASREIALLQASLSRLTHRADT